MSSLRIRWAGVIPVGVVMGAAGCSGLAGSWRTVDVRPQGAPFPIHEVTFDSQERYTATGLFDAQGAYDGDTHTTTGTYTQGIGSLKLSPIGGPTLVYKTRRRLDGRLVMTFKPAGQERPVTAVLAPAKP